MNYCKRCGCLQGDLNPHNGTCEPMPKGEPDDPMEMLKDFVTNKTQLQKVIDSVFDDIDRAATFPGSVSLNWHEISFATIEKWVRLYPQQKVAPTEDFDIESVKGMIEQWWRELEDEPGTCPCRSCNPNAQTMIVCPTCGNKRCPHANHHDNPCTNSNEPGQAGSAY